MRRKYVCRRMERIERYGKVSGGVYAGVGSAWYVCMYVCVCVYIRIYVRIYVVAILTGSESGEMGCRRDGRAGDNDIYC